MKILKEQDQLEDRPIIFKVAMDKYKSANFMSVLDFQFALQPHKKESIGSITHETPLGLNYSKNGSKINQILKYSNYQLTLN